MDKLMAVFDGMDTSDKASLSGHAFDTSIDIKNLETGEIIFKGLKNKVIISGSGLVARKLFDISNPEISPSYNTIFGDSMYTPDVDSHNQESLNGTTATKEEPKVVLFCCGIDGCGSENSQVYPVDYTKWIAPENMIPFRYQVGTNDISDALREAYFGRTLINGGEYIAYYFKRFDNEPTLVQQYIDGTPVDNSIWSSVKTEEAETYIEITLKVTKEDMRDYFNATTGVDSSRINSLSLCYGYPVVVTEKNIEGKDVERVYYKDIHPLTKLHFPNEALIDQTKGIEIIYHIYM